MGVRVFVVCLCKFEHGVGLSLGSMDLVRVDVRERESVCHNSVWVLLCVWKVSVM